MRLLLLRFCRLGTQCASGTYFAELSNASTTGGTWSINNGGVIDANTGEIDLELTGEGNYTMTYAVGDTDCSAEAFQDLEIGAAAVAEVLPLGTLNVLRVLILLN